MRPVVGRFAPSPSGYMHMGNLLAMLLAWLDCRSLGIPSVEIEKSLMEKEKVRINNGLMYGTEGFIRINLACPPALLEDGLDRIARGLRRLIDSK